MYALLLGLFDASAGWGQPGHYSNRVLYESSWHDNSPKHVVIRITNIFYLSPRLVSLKKSDSSCIVTIVGPAAIRGLPNRIWLIAEFKSLPVTPRQLRHLWPSTVSSFIPSHATCVSKQSLNPACIDFLAFSSVLPSRSCGDHQMPKAVTARCMP